MRARVAGTATPRELPVQKLGKIKEVSERGPRRLELLDLGPGASTSLPGGAPRDVVPPGRQKPKRPPKALDLGPGAFTGGQGRTARIRDGKALLAATDEQIGFITTVGWLGICSTLPVVALCSWQRALLIVACLANALAPVVRYFAASACYHDGGYDALACSYTLVALSNYVQGAAFGVLGAWPSLLGAQWPQVLPLTVPSH